MKAQALPEIPLIGLIGTITIIVGILIPTSVIKTTIDKELNSTYEYERMQYALLTLMSSTHEGKPVYELLADNINKPQNLKFLNNDLEKLIGFKCYSLQVGVNDKFTTVIESNPSNPCKKLFTFTTVITQPYNPDPDSRIKYLRIDTGESGS